MNIKRYFYPVLALAIILLLNLGLTGMAGAAEFSALNNRGSDIAIAPRPHNLILLPDVVAPSKALSNTPQSGWSYLYMDGDALIFKDDSGTTTDLTVAGTVNYSDIGDPTADTLIVFANDEINRWTLADVNEDMFTIQGIGAFGNVSIFKVEQKTGNATDGTVAEFVSADTDVDALLVTANSIDVILVNGDGTLTLTGATDLTGNLDITGNLAISGTWTIDAIAASTATQTLTLDGDTTGGVDIGSTSTGNITLGDDVVVRDTFNVLIGEGSLTIDNDQNEDALVITSSATSTGSAINIVAANTTDNVIHVTADDLGTGGAVLHLDTDNIAADNFFIEAFNGSSNQFTVSLYGATVISGNASTDVLTVTAGDIQITSGDIDLDSGFVAIDTAADQTSYIERAQATVTGPVFSVIEQTDPGAGDDEAALFVDTDATDAGSSGILIDSEGAIGLVFAALVAAGDAIKIDVANTYTGQGIVADLGPWVGTIGEGFISITSDSGAVNEVGQAIQVNLQGTGTAGTAVEGKAFHAESQAAVKSGESLVYLDTLTNTALHIDNEGTTADGIKFDVAGTYTGQGILADLGTHTGTVSEGFINIETDAAATAVVGQILRINLQDSLVDVTAISGKAIFAKEVSPVKAGTHLVHLESTNNGALNVAAGDVTVADDILANGNITGDGATVMSAVLQDSEIVAAANNDLAFAECGKVMFLNAAGGFQTTLPAISTVPAGCTFEFIVTAVGANYTIITDNSLENVLHGGVVERETDTGDDGPFQAAGDTMTLVNGNMVISDYIKLISNGSLYFVTGQVNADGAFTIVQAD